MTGWRARMTGLLYDDPGAERIVPRGGFGTWLVVLATAAMAFLAVFAIALSGATLRAGQSWQTELSGTATVQITSTGADRERDTEIVLTVLATTPGIAAAHVVSDLEQQALLAPWFGRDLPLDALPLPRLIAITTDRGGYDADNLALRLAGEAPQSRLDDHDRWRVPLARAQARLAWVVAISLVLITGTFGAITALAAGSALAAQTQVIEVLRLVGARDGWIARAFVRRITRRAVLGAVLGTLIGCGLLISFPPPTQLADTAPLPSLRPHGLLWLAFVALPLFSGGVAFVTTRSSALRILKGRP